MWSGARDQKGYAMGYGTLTWYTPEKATLTGSFIARPRHYTVSSRVSGTMVRGKFEEAPPGPKPKHNETSPKILHSTPPPEKAGSRTATPTPTPANDSLDPLMHVPPP